MTRQKNEAISRLKKFYGNDFPFVIEDFKRDIINLTENGGFLYWLDDNQREIVKNFERENGAIVYTVIRNFQPFETLSLLYVSKYENQWKDECYDLENNEPIAYVYNVDCPEFSEFGAIGIGINSATGGLIRTF